MRRGGQAPTGEQGSLAPLMLAVTAAALFLMVGLLQVGLASGLRAEAQTAADSAALAGAESLKAQMQQLLLQTGFNEPRLPLNEDAMRDAAEDYAARNGASVVAFDFDPAEWEVFVRVVSNDELQADGWLSEVAGERGVSEARATLEMDFAVGGAGGAPTTSGGGAGLTDAELAEVAGEVAGVDDVPADSALRRYHGDGFSSQTSVSGLTLAMRASVLRLEQALGSPLQINSGYRHPSYQAELCQQVSGPCAPPGKSMHNHGLAIDVDNHGQVAAAVNADPDIGLCQPLPANDAVHFSHVTGSECAGRGGTLGQGEAFGGNPNSFATFEVRLVD